ncbi:MAG: hypothetical protein ACTSRZ_04005 [Promethearchaeota archaeon]
MTQMHYMFRFLALGDKKLVLSYIEGSNTEPIFRDYEIIHYKKNIRTLEGNICDIEVDAIISDTIDYDNLIPTCDGIIYFINPNRPEEFNLFEIIIGIINELERALPVVIVFYAKDGYCKIPSNYLLEYIWNNTYYEAFIFNKYSDNKFNEILECLSDAIVLGINPINIETAWLRIPILIEKINYLVLKEEWLKAANYLEILTEIKKRFEFQDYYINAEQSSWLYFKQGNFLKASQLLEGGINEKKYRLFRELYVKDLIQQGERFYKLQRYYSSAENFEKAALWSSIELNDPEIYLTSIRKAIKTWVKAGEFQNAFNLIDKLEHNEQLKIMEEIVQDIINVTDLMLNKKNFDILKAQLYLCVDRYQRSGLFEAVKALSGKIKELLKILLNLKIRDKKPHEALLYIEEIWSICEAFDIEIENFDDSLVKITDLFIEQNEFNMLDKVLQKVQSRDTQIEITELWNRAEEKFESKRRETAIADFKKIASLLDEYIIEEIRQFEEYNNKLIAYAEELIKSNQYWEGCLILKQRAEWFKKLSLNRYFNTLAEKFLILYLDAPKPYLPQFLKDIYLMPNEARKQFLINRKQNIINAINIISNSTESYENVYNMINQIIKLYRTHLLYEDVKDITHTLVVFIIKRAAMRLFSSKGLNEVPLVLNMLKEAKSLYEETNKKEELNYDKILEEIVLRYLEEGDTVHAAQINEQIKTREIFSELHKKILKLEEIKSEKATESVKKEVKWKIKEEFLSQLKNQARDVFLAKESKMKRRVALKRVLYKDALNALQDQNWDEAYYLYRKTAFSLLNKRKIETAGEPIAIMALILIKKDNYEKINDLLQELEKETSIFNILKQTLVIRILDYIKDMYEFKKKKKVMEAISLFENLALFPEELQLLYDVLGKKAPSSLSNMGTTTTTETTSAQKIESMDKKRADMKLADIASIKQLLQKLEPKKNLFNRRKMMRRKYWENAINLLTTQNYKTAANEYFNIALQLKEKGHKDFISLAYLMGIISLLKINLSSDALNIYNKISIEFGTADQIISKFPELFLIEQLIKAFKIQNTVFIDYILEGFINFLPLFEVEKSLIYTMISTKLQAKVSKSIKKEKIDKNQKIIILNQQMDNLKQAFRDAAEIYASLLKKRNAMKRIYFKDIVELLPKREFKNLAELYKSTAIRVSQRNDYEHAGVLILLGCLALFKLKLPIEEIRQYYNSFLDRIGFTKNVIDKTYAAKLLQILIDAYIINEPKIIKQIEQFLPRLPLLEQEKILIENL